MAPKLHVTPIVHEPRACSEQFPQFGRLLALIVVGLAAVVALPAIAPAAWAQSESLPADSSSAAQEPADTESLPESLADESRQTRQDITYVRDANEQAKHEQAQLAEKLAALQARLERLEAELEASQGSTGEAADPE